ncbi:TPA: hypothetical protein MIC13_22095 [Klebsiella pneumoniae]|nr:hypothetical protein [Klebsiella pneumoniae]HBX7041123.1 hypothetical protein [Klebsiella pneumoniae]HBX7073258.1 hypothetical protein [Klebsiella pneumoniae]HBX7131899.1 hypothetical protein [Klebsiella pneumoniae]HBX7175106.1 hypothetical protein [Klebsiella pneumoniae]
MTVIVLMWEEAAIKDDIIEYDIAFNIIYIMRTKVCQHKALLSSQHNSHASCTLSLHFAQHRTAILCW